MKKLCKILDFFLSFRYLNPEQLFIIFDCPNDELKYTNFGIQQSSDSKSSILELLLSPIRLVTTDLDIDQKLVNMIGDVKEKKLLIPVLKPCNKSYHTVKNILV